MLGLGAVGQTSRDRAGTSARPAVTEDRLPDAWAAFETASMAIS